MLLVYGGCGCEVEFRAARRFQIELGKEGFKFTREEGMIARRSRGRGQSLQYQAQIITDDYWYRSILTYMVTSIALVENLLRICQTSGAELLSITITVLKQSLSQLLLRSCDAYLTHNQQFLSTVKYQVTKSYSNQFESESSLIQSTVTQPSS